MLFCWSRGFFSISKKSTQKEVVKLLAIMNQNSKNGFVSREYVREKLDRILDGMGIGIHPSLEKFVELKLKELK